jgi:hypothetical protein
MHAKWIAVLLFGLLASLLFAAGASQQGVGQEPKRTTETADRFAPPDIKIGVKVQFISADVRSVHLVDARAPKVSKIQGYWVYLDGEVRSGDNIGSGWVNFNNVQWYRIVAEK